MVGDVEPRKVVVVVVVGKFSNWKPLVFERSVMLGKPEVGWPTEVCVVVVRCQVSELSIYPDLFSRGPFVFLVVDAQGSRGRSSLWFSWTPELKHLDSFTLCPDLTAN